MIKYPNADMSKFEINTNTTSDGKTYSHAKINVFFGAWAIFGDSPENFNNFSEPNKSKLFAALGRTF